jgi:YesN/AraC family two-component response regulator
MKTNLGLIVVDDHRFIRESIIRSIDWASLGIDILGEAQNGSDALDVVTRLKPDIVITDIKMPGADGLELAGKIGKISSRSKVIIITGFQEFEYALRALKLGVVDLVLKPIKNEELIKAVRKAIEAIERERSAPAATDSADTCPSRPSYGLLVDSMLAYIDLHYAENLTLDRIAEEFRLNASYTSRLIAKASGTSFVQHVNRRRIEAAERLLADPSLRIKEIVNACGFSDYTYFLKVFRDLAGCTPQQYRARLTIADRSNLKNDL